MLIDAENGEESPVPNTELTADTKGDLKLIYMVFKDLFLCAIGCWLGSPHTHVIERKKIWIPRGDANKVSMAEAISTNPPRLACNLLSVFFTKDELSKGNCTPAQGRNLLDPNIIQGIRCNVNSTY